MACANLDIKGLNGSCDSSKGGIKKVYIALRTAGDPYTIASASTGELSVSAITSGYADSWYEYELKKGTGSMTSTLNVDAANGVNYVTTEVVLQFLKMDNAKRMEMAALALDDLAVIVEDANGIRWALGISEPVVATAGTGQTGTARTDGNFYTLTLTDDYDTWPVALAPGVEPEVRNA